MATASLSYGERKFGQSYSIRLLIGLMFAGLLVGIWAGVDDQQFNPSAHPTLLWISIALLAAYAALWVVMGKTILTLSDEGVRRESAFGMQEMAWGQIRETRYMVTPVRYAAHFGLIGMLVAAASKSPASVNLRLILIASDGRKLKIASTFKNAKDAVGIIFGKILPPMVSEVRSRIQHGETVKFDDLSLSATQLTWKGQAPIPLTELGSAEIVGTNLRIKRPGKWKSVVNVRSNKIPNVLVLLEVLEGLAPQLKSTQIDPLARVRV